MIDIKEFVDQCICDFGSYWSASPRIGPTRIAFLSTPWTPGDWWHERLTEQAQDEVDDEQ